MIKERREKWEIDIPENNYEVTEQMKPGTITINNANEAQYPYMAIIPFEDIISKVVKEAPGKLLQIELTNESGYLVYNVEVVNTEKQIIRIFFDAGNSETLLVSSKRDEKKEEEIIDPKVIPITPGSIKLSTDYEAAFVEFGHIPFEVACNIALNQIPGKIRNIELSNVQDYLVFDVEVVNSAQEIIKVIIDAGNGKILWTSI